VTPYRLRLASAADAEAICRIYNQGIEDRVATLETELRTPDERRQWLASRGARHPVIVAEVEPQARTSEGLSGRAEPARASLSPPSAQAGLTVPATIGWASLNVFNARDAYRFVADISVYVERGWRGKGVGRVMLEKLVELGRTHGYHKLVLSAFPGNAAGMALYSKSGFRTVGIYHEQGQLDGQWVDTIIMEKVLEARASG
jgi:phosphinothricin acetyltransferase